MKESLVNKDKLFSNEPIEKAVRKKNRPLAELSNFIVDELPKVLVESSPEIAFEKLEKSLLRNPNKIVRKLKSMQEAELLLARLDLLMFEAAFRSFGHQSDSLQTILGSLQTLTQRPTIVTYEDIVIDNPADDIRTFTTGIVGKHEAGFYIGHKIIEGKLAQVIRNIQDVRAKRKGNENNVALIRQATQLLDEVIVLTQNIGFQMDVTAFSQFRGYLGSSIDQSGVILQKGPSGAFSAKVPTVDLLIAGKLSDTHAQYVKENSQYFPLREMNQLAQLMNTQLDSLTTIFSKDGQDVTVVEELIKKIKQFRGMHIRAVKNQVPGLIEGEGVGTAGVSAVGKFLKERINDY